MKKFHIIIFASIIAVLNVSCATQNVQKDRKLNDIALNGQVYSAVWQQNAGEFQALCLQAYNVATKIVEEKSSVQHFRPIAIVTDIDETILDNSPYAVTQAQRSEERRVGNEP